MSYKFILVKISTNYKSLNSKYQTQNRGRKFLKFNTQQLLEIVGF